MRNIRPLRSAILLMAFTCTAFIVVSPKLVNAQVQQQHQARFFSALLITVKEKFCLWRWLLKIRKAAC